MGVTIKNKVVGVVVGYDMATFAIVGVRGDIIARDSFYISTYHDINDFAGMLCEKITSLVAANGGMESIRSVGISVPSGNNVTGCVENSPNMPWKGRIPLASMLRDRLGLAVGLGNDAHATAVGEAAYGVAHGMRNFIVVLLGNGGLGSCFFCNGRAHLGVEGYAGEFGHTCYKVGGRKCSCGQEGCLEAYVSARGMIQTAREILDQHPEMDSMLRRMPEMTMKILKQACEMEDKVALETVRYTSRILGMKLANYASIVDPEAVILTGELAMFGKWMMPDLRACFEENVFHNSRDKIELLFSDFDEGERDILGASALAWTVKEYSLFK